MERLLETSDSSTPLHERETREMLRFYDDYLPRNPVHIFCHVEDNVLLRLRIKAVNNATPLIKKISRVCLRLPNEEMIELEMQQVCKTNRDTLDAVCLLESCVFKDIIAQNSRFAGFWHVYCHQTMIHVHVMLSGPRFHTGIICFILRYKVFNNSLNDHFVHSRILDHSREQYLSVRPFWR